MRTLFIFVLFHFRATFAYVIHYEDRPKTELQDIFETNGCDPECQASETILRNLNLSVDPCADFYEFTCGGWIKDHPVPATQSHINQFQIAEEKLQTQIKEILEKIDAHDPDPVQAASFYYKACVNSDRIEKESMNQLVKFLAEYGGWPMTMENWNPNNFNWLKLSTDSIRRLSVKSLMNVNVGLDRLDSNHSVVLIDQPSLVLSRSMLVDAVNYKIHVEAYRDWIAATAMIIVKHTNQSIPVDVLEKKSLNIIQFEIELAKLTSSNEMRRNAFRMYNNMTLRDLQEWTNSATPDFKIDWLEIMQIIFSETDIHIDYGHRVVVKELDYFFNLAILLQNTPAEILADYLQWRIVMTFSQDLTNDLRALVFQFDEVYSGIFENEPRWKSCLDSVMQVLNFAVGYAYVKEYFDEETMIMAKSMVNNILTAFSHQLKQAEWMDEQTKLSALDKVHSIALFIGYPEWYNNVSALYTFYDGLAVGPSHFENIEQLRTYLYRHALLKLNQITDRNEWVTGPSIVNAFNNGQTNSIILPAGMLQPPFFDARRIMAMNYGSIGAVIGHEILHGFDDIGRLTDKYGNLAQWWTEDVIATYEKKTKCFVDQYSKFNVPTAAEINHTTTLSVNGIYTQGENIADNSGLRQAFFAYQKYVQDNGEEKPLVVAVHKFSPEQLFFISYATAWCESNTKHSLMQEVLNDSHSPHKIRVTGTLSNFPEFAKIFRCPENSPMNPKTKCIIW